VSYEPTSIRVEHQFDITMYRHKSMVHHAGIPPQLSAYSNSGTRPFLLPLSQALKRVTYIATT